jgi:multidrug transporter EmrE-like cation transporter
MSIIDFIKNWKNEILFVVFTIAIIEAIAQNIIKQNNLNSLKFLFALFCLNIVGFILYYAYHKFPLSKVNVIWSSLTIILAALAGYILYNETMNLKTITAIILCLIAIYLYYDI